MDNTITYLTLRGKELKPYQDKILQFLLNLTDERKTLYTKEYSDEDYQRICKILVENIIFTVLAKFKGEIIGVDALTNSETGLLYQIFPTVSSFIVVSNTFQGRGIGTTLNRKVNEILGKTWAFKVGAVLKNNSSMIRIQEKQRWTRVTEDDTLIYHYRPCRKEMNLISPLFFVSYWIFIKSKRVRKLAKDLYLMIWKKSKSTLTGKSARQVVKSSSNSFRS
jgi:hypothetical protein